MKTESTIKVLIFDLGNVIINIDFEKCFEYWADKSGEKVETLKRNFSQDTFYEKHERGQISGKEYSSYINKTLGMNISYDDFVTGWSAILREPIDETVAFMNSNTCKDLKIFCLTNSNVLHRNVWSVRYRNELKNIHKIFCSSQIEARKPEPQSYKAVLQEAKVHPNEIIFIDDLKKNIDGANQLGIQGLLFKEPKKSIQKLESLINKSAPLR